MTSLSPLQQPQSLNSWQSQIQHRLLERDRNANAYHGLIHDYQRLAQHARSLRSTPPTSSLSTPSTTSSKSVLPTSDPTTVSSDPSIINQLNSAKEELSSLYKTQGQNAQRLLDLTDQLRDRDERNRLNEEELRVLREENSKFERKKEEWEGRLNERLTAVQILQDELQALSLELTMTEERNDALRKDNASLLQRWLDKVRDEVESVNEKNEMEENSFRERERKGKEKQEVVDKEKEKEKEGAK